MAGKEIGQLGAITPAVTFIVAPLWGALADHTGRHKDVLMFTFVTSVISRLLFIYKVGTCSGRTHLLLRASRPF
jgi:nitrate/nitrite transporter NarK